MVGKRVMYVCMTTPQPLAALAALGFCAPAIGGSAAAPPAGLLRPPRSQAHLQIFAPHLTISLVPLVPISLLVY